MKAENSVAQIKCINYSHIHFSQSQCIHITNLEFIGCGGNQVKRVEEFVVHKTKFEGKVNSETALELIRTTAQIVNSTFVSNRRGKCVHCDEYDRFCTFIGGAIIATNSIIDISQSKFEDNGADSLIGGAIYAKQYSIIKLSSNVFVHSRMVIALYFHSSIITTNASEVWSTTRAFSYREALTSINSTITIYTSEFYYNYRNFYFSSSIATIKGSEFHRNYGRALTSYNSIITIEECEFHHNSASSGGVLHSSSSTITIVASKFYNNRVTPYRGIYAAQGGVLYSDNSTITIETSEFHENSALKGGVLYSVNSTITIEASEFYDNNAPHGGVIHSINSTVTNEASDFYYNNAINSGGVLYSLSSSITIGSSSNCSNNTSPIGAVIYATDSSKIYLHNYLLIESNLAGRYAVIYLFDSELRGRDSANVTFSSNLGSLVAFNSNITFSGYVELVNNQQTQTIAGDFQEGGAITLIQSSAVFDGECNFEQNSAENGGAIQSTDSKLYINGGVMIAHNTAARNGGGFYLSNSELNCQKQSTLTFANNTAVHKGGGLHAISSSVKAASAYSMHQYTGSRINFIGNTAKKGGGLSLEANTKYYILKYQIIYYYEDTDTNTTIFIANSADYGGAVYVNDDSNSGICSSDPKTECFFQVLAIHNRESYYLKIQSIYFSQNYAHMSGSTLYGGLLDRCAVNPFAEVRYEWNSGQNYEYIGNGASYFEDISSGESNLTSSQPAQVCFCSSNKDSPVRIKKGETFTLSVVAVDQIGQPVSATIQTSLHFTESGLAEGQLARKRPAECTNLTFNVASPHNFEILTLYASDGPCKDADLSRRTVEIHFLPCSCPIGLQPSGMNNTNCTCDCHRNISQYMEQCDSHTGSLVKQPRSRAWISYISDTDLVGYLVYPNCPFDYCLSTSPPVDLNQPNGADTQCAFNRSSLLCGSCQPGLSLSLGSSRCLSCPSHWPVLLIIINIVAILAGIALVTLLLMLNMTVAVGTLNGLIFYANVVYANKGILLSFQETNFITVIISWLNLELGIDTCYFPGMGTYIKTWLQLAFPVYVILLVVSVIIISSCSAKFSNLIGRKNPVATLATLILLSYTKLLEVCFKTLSVGILKYPNNNFSKILWLPDATVKYLTGKHSPLFIVAVLILLIGLIYTALLFSW